METLHKLAKLFLQLVLSTVCQVSRSTCDGDDCWLGFLSRMFQSPDRKLRRFAHNSIQDCLHFKDFLQDLSADGAAKRGCCRLLGTMYPLETVKPDVQAEIDPQAEQWMPTETLFGASAETEPTLAWAEPELDGMSDRKAMWMPLASDVTQCATEILAGVVTLTCLVCCPLLSLALLHAMCLGTCTLAYHPSHTHTECLHLFAILSVSVSHNLSLCLVSTCHAVPRRLLSCLTLSLICLSLCLSTLILSQQSLTLSLCRFGKWKDDLLGTYLDLIGSNQVS